MQNLCFLNCALRYKYVIRNKKKFTFFINVLIQLYFLRHVSIDQVFILRKTSTCIQNNHTSNYISFKVNGNNLQCLKTIKTVTPHRLNQEIKYIYIYISQGRKRDERLYKNACRSFPEDEHLVNRNMSKKI